MQKTKLGISIGYLGAIIYFAGLLGGYVPVLLLGGYVLLKEDDSWLRKVVLKAITTLILFDSLNLLVSFLSDFESVFQSINNIFGGEVYLSFLGNVTNGLTTTLKIIEILIFVVLGLKALKQKDIVVPISDDLINRYSGQMGINYVPSNQVCCSNCGNMVPKGLRFCTSCGQELVKTKENDNRPSDQEMICPKCGTKVNKNQTFCKNCGNKL